MTTQWTPPPVPPFDPPTNSIPVQQRGPAPFYPPAQPPPPARRGAIVLAAVLGLLFGGGAVAAVLLSSTGPTTGGSLFAADTFEFTGSLTLTDTDSRWYGSTPCSGSGGYSDISAGSSVTVSDAAGKVVATGSLGSGQGAGSTCLFPFTIADVPAGSDFYRVEVSHRGEVTYSRADLDAGRASLSLGS